MGPEFYCIDDTSFAGWLENSSNIVADIEAFSGMAEKIINDGQSIAVPSSIDTVQIGENFFFYDLYALDFSNSDKIGNLDRDSIARLMALRNRLDTTTIEVDQPTTLFKTTGECVRDSCDSGIAEIIVHQKANGVDIFALLLIGSGGPVSGEYQLHINGNASNEVYALHTLSDIKNYARWLISVKSKSEEDFFAVWSRAFPSLLKANDLTFQRFDGNYLTLYKDVLFHLTFLNDDCLRLWRDCAGDFVCFQRTAKSHGINLSNEGDNTRKNIGKMRKRVAEFSGQEVICELHTKLRWDKNRIHFHPPIDAIKSGSVLVGIFVDHLEV